MSYIGNTVQNQSYAPAVDFFNGDGSTTAFTLSRPVYSTPMVQVVISNVPQNPGSAYTINGNTITFTSAPPAGTANIYVYYTSPNTTVAVLPQSPVISGDLTTTGGHYAIGAFNSGYTDGIVMDYTTGTGRITVGGSDGVSFYNGGPSARSFLFGSDSSGNVGIAYPNPAGVRLAVKGADSTSSNYGLVVQNSSGTNTYYVRNDGYASWNNNAMTLDSSGNLLVNTISQIQSAKVSTVVSSGYNYSLRNSGATSGKSWGIGVDGNNSIVIYNNGNTGVWIGDGGTAWNSSSDETLKENLEPITDALTKVSSLRTVTGNYINDAYKKTHSFLIAQDVQKVLPEAVTPDIKGKLGLAYTETIPLLVAAIQELKAEVDALKAQLKGAA